MGPNDLFALFAQAVETSTILLVASAVLAALLLWFVVRFLLPGAWLWFKLGSIRRRLRAVDAKAPPAELQSLFVGDRRLSKLWQEYLDSLHVQSEVQEGQSVVVARRATAPAEALFNAQTVVDDRLSAEFFKHLPGIFTGTGIIGTFFGMVEGLQQFQVSEDPTAVRASLETLMHMVGDAFLVSLAAIFLAMVITLFEKALVAILYRQTADIGQLIDSMFLPGVGEEYLSRVARAAEDSASQAKILKDALVSELGDLLRQLTASQVDAAHQNSVELGKQIIDGIEHSLVAPMNGITSLVEKSSSDQSSATIQMLQDVMASFSERLNTLFGGQIAGLNDLNRQTSQSVQDAVQGLQALLAQMEASGQRSSEEMTQRMIRVLDDVEQRQQAMNDQSKEFIEQVNQLISGSQMETQNHVQQTLEALGHQTAELLQHLAKSQEQAADSNREREDAMASRARASVTDLTQSTAKIVEEMQAATTAMSQGVAAFVQAGSDTREDARAGARLLASAAKDFALAGRQVAGTMEQAAGISKQIKLSADGLATGADALQAVLRDYGMQRDAMAGMLADLRTTVEATRREASLTGDVLQRIEQSAESLREAQLEAQQYLDGVSEVLAKAHDAFGQEVKRTLDRANQEFHEKLSSAVSLLGSAIAELDTTLATIGVADPEGH